MSWPRATWALLLCVPHVLQAQSGMTIKSGWSVSAFADQDRSPKVGVVFGIDKEWALTRKLSLSFELAYTTRGGVLQEKVVGSGFRYASRYWRSQICSMGFLELPVLCRYQVGRSPLWEWQLTAGVALAVAVNNNSEVLRSEEIPNSYDPVTGEPTMASDYDWWDGEALFSPASENSDVVAHLGVGVKRGHYHAELRCALPFWGLADAAEVDLRGKRYYAVAVMLGVWLPKQPDTKRETTCE